MAEEVIRRAIVDKDGGGLVASVVQSTADPTKYGVVLLNPDGSSITGGGTSTLAQVSSNSTDAASAIYDLTEDVPVHFRWSSTNAGLYLDDTNEVVGINTTSPSTGAPLTVYKTGIGVLTRFESSASDNMGFIEYRGGGARKAYIGFGAGGPANNYFSIANTTNNGIVFNTNNTDRSVITANGRWGLGVIASSLTAQVHIRSTTEQLRLEYDASNYASHTVDSSSNYTVTTANNGDITLSPGGSGTTTVEAGSGGVVIQTDAGNADIDITAHGSGTVNINSTELILDETVGPTDVGSAGFRGIPQNSQSADYTLVLADAGGYVYHPATDANNRTFTIPANASVAYPIGTALTFVNQSANNLSIAITTDTMYLAGTGTTGTRTLAQYGVATAIKDTSTSWIISGPGLT